MKNKNWYIKIWNEGKYLDFWSINHILGGLVFARFLIFINFSFWIGFFIALLYMLLWEVYEIAKKVKETNANRILDVLTGVFGFLLGFYLITENILNDKIFITTILTPFIILQFWGYMAYIAKK
jgi:uncharacterized membrane protein HdeD (DUF308 family)